VLLLGSRCHARFNGSAYGNKTRQINCQTKRVIHYKNEEMKTEFINQFFYAPGSNDAQIEERLWDYIDGLSSHEEKNCIEELIATQQEWRNKYQQLLQTHQLVQHHLELDEPSMRFTQNVMEEITRLQIAPATKTYIDKKIIYGIGGFFAIMIIGLMVFTLGQLNWGSSGSDATGKLLTDYSQKLEWGKLFNNTYTNVFIMVNAVLGLLLLDVYLGKKRKKLYQQES
jgi:hypothetical protein